MDNGRILVNCIKTPDGTIITSTHRHDYVSHIDKNGKTYAVDGGTSYLRRVYEEKDYQEISIFEKDDIEKIREIFYWISYGKDGKQPRTKVILKDMEKEHIEAILDTQTYINDTLKNVFHRELEFRTQNKVQNQ